MASDESPSDVPPPAVAIVIWNDLASTTSSTRTTQAKCPERFQKKGQKRTEEELSRNLQEKQLKAQRNKEAYEAARCLRIRQRREQCRNMASKMEKLLAQDAKRQGIAGTENIQPMTRKEAGAMIQSVNRDFQQLGAALGNNMGT